MITLKEKLIELYFHKSGKIFDNLNIDEEFIRQLEKDTEKNKENTIQQLSTEDYIKWVKGIYNENFNDKDRINELIENIINKCFDAHVKENLETIEIQDITKYKDYSVIIDTPDGFQELGDFYMKTKRPCYKIQTLNNSISCSEDHLIEMSYKSKNIEWKKASLIKIGDPIVTKDGEEKVILNSKLEDSIVYDFEVLHENHRYWGGSGISSHNTGKTFLMLNAVKNAQDKGYYIYYYDSENAIDQKLVEKFGIDPRKFFYVPCNTVQEFRTSITNLTKTLIEQKRKGIEIPKVMVALDSAGNLATQKEIDDAVSGSEKSDMTRAKVLKSIFRIIMTPMAECKIPFIFSNHSYQCILGDYKVILANGDLKPIKDLVKGDYVQTLDGPKLVEDTTKFNKSRTITIELENGKKLTGTPEHRFLVSNDWKKETSWKTLEMIEEGDEILMNESFVLENKY
jgi:hypothetical protein